MDQYPLPQFIEQEGKIAFFLSFRQFFYLVGAGLVCFFLFYLLPFVLFLPVAAIIFIGSIALAFIRISGMSIVELALSSFGFAIGGKSYIWKKKESPYPFKPMERTQIKKINNQPVLQAQQSQLKKIKTAVELKTK